MLNKNGILCIALYRKNLVDNLTGGKQNQQNLEKTNLGYTKYGSISAAIDDQTIKLKKFDINLDSNIVVDYGPMFVNPKYVGNKLQYQMLKEIDKYSLSLGYKYAAGTIHPENIYSINNLLKDNFELTGTKEFTRGIRKIYLKKLY